MNNKQSLLTEEEQRLFDHLHEIGERDSEILNRRRNKGYKDRVINMYPESAHFLFELLQNADDAKASEARFIISSERLIFKHNGSRHFSITPDYDNEPDKKVGDINAILSVGDSAKDGVETIGKFGVGFKSVFQYTDAPEIYDDKFKFKIIDYRIPVQLYEDPFPRKEGETMFVIPFKNPEKDYTNILPKLKALQNPLLFLNNLQYVECESSSENDVFSIIYKKDILSTRTFNNISLERIKDEKQRELLLFSKKIPVTYNGVESNPRICIGFYLKTNGKTIDTDVHPKIYCFFHTSQSFGMCFISHAPFLTTDNRDGFLPDNEVNEYLINQLLDLYVETLHILKTMSEENGEMLFNVLDMVPVEYCGNLDREEFIPLRGETYDLSALYRKVTSAIQSEALAYGTDEKFHQLSELFYKPSTFPYRIFGEKQLKELSDNPDASYIKSDNSAKLKSYIEEELKLPSIDMEWVSGHITEDFMKKQDMDWLLSFYKYLDKFRTSLSLFSHKPILLTSDGDFTSKYTSDDKPNIFLPYEDGTSDIQEFKFLHPSIVKNTDLESFIKYGLSLTPPKAIDYIRTIIFPRYNNNETDEEKVRDFESAFKVYRDMKDKIDRKSDDYYTKEWEFNDLVIVLKSEMYVVCSDDKALHKVSTVYEEDDNTKKYFSDDMTFHPFDLKFYISKGTLSKEDILPFIHKLGIDTNHPRILTIDSFDSAYRKDFEIEGFEHSLADAENSKIMWESLKKAYVKPEYDYTQKYRRYRSRNHFETYFTNSKLRRQLSDEKWIFSPDGMQYKPVNISVTLFRNFGYSSIPSLELMLDFGKDDKMNDYWRRQAQKEAAQQKRQEINSQLEKLVGDDKDKLQQIIDLLSRLSSNDEEAEAFFKIISSSSNWSDMASINAAGDDNIPQPESPDDNDDIDGNDAGWSIEFDDPHSLVRKTIHYIGCKLYESYLKKIGTDYERADDAPYDFRIGEDQYLVVSAIESKDQEDASPIHMKRDMHAFMLQHPNTKFQIARMSLVRLGINYDYEVKSLHDRSADVDTDENLRKDCDRLVSNYWSSGVSSEFEKNTPVYEIRIIRK